LGLRGRLASAVYNTQTTFARAGIYIAGKTASAGGKAVAVADIRRSAHNIAEAAAYITRAAKACTFVPAGKTEFCIAFIISCRNTFF
jgi:hypothetical protein